MQIHGFRTTTITLNLEAGRYVYPLTFNKLLGIPRQAKILYITTRAGDPFGTFLSYNGNPLSRFVQAGTLTLNRKKGQTNIYQDYNLEFLVDSLVSPFAYGFLEPIENQFINWTTSFVRFPTQPGLVDNTTVELTIHYALDNAYFPKVCDIQSYYSGVQFMGIRQALVSVETSAGEQAFPFSFNSNIGIPKNAYILGFTPLQTVTADGIGKVNITVENSSFVTLVRGDKNIVYRLPYNYRVNPGLGMPYIPIEPLKVDDFDTQNSEIFCGAPASVVDNEAYIFNFYYVCDERSEEEQEEMKRSLGCYY